MTIGLSYHKGFAPLSKLIRWWQGTSYSHTYIQLGNKVWHATGKGVHIISKEEFLKNNVTVKEYYFDNVDSDLVEIICTSHSGKKYGFVSILGIFIRDTIGIKLIGSDDNQTFICSELVGLVLELVLEVELGDQNYFTPRDIEEKLNWIKYKKR